MTQPRILIVDDDPEIRHLLQQFLCKYDYTVATAEDGDAMFEMLEKATFELIILDVLMPGDDGFTVCRKLRRNSTVPVIMLTAVAEDVDRITGLEIGADDYVAKPFNPRELLARIKAILRRSTKTDDEASDALSLSAIYEFNAWTLDSNTRQMTDPDGVDIALSGGEYDLLRVFLTHSQRVLSRDQLMDLAKRKDFGPYDRSIDVQVSRLRKKIECDPKQPKLIKTVRGGGYMFTAKVMRK